MMYGLVFAFTGIMMTDAAIVDCIFINYPWTVDRLHMLVLDLALTSTIGIGFFICAL
jgi:hypothetical protein